MSHLSAMSISEVNKLCHDKFIERYGNVVEHCSICAAAVWRNRPFRDVNQLHREICSFIDLLPDSGREGILRLHPDLAGRMSQLGTLTQESSSEQIACGMDTLTVEEKTLLAETNAKYLDRFGFPFVICARLNKKEAILKGIVERLENNSAEELNAGIEEVKKICRLRLESLIIDDE